MDDQSTAEQHQAIRMAARDRVAYLLWLAKQLLATDHIAIRREAAAVIRQLVS
jgi:hypothetical protein